MSGNRNDIEVIEWELPAGVEAVVYRGDRDYLYVNRKRRKEPSSIVAWAEGKEKGMHLKLTPAQAPEEEAMVTAKGSAGEGIGAAGRVVGHH